jgi:hypothetical protein
MYDIDLAVAVSGLHLLRLLVQQGVLAAKDVSEVYKLLGEESPALRSAAAALVVLLLEEQGMEAWREQKGRASSQQVWKGGWGQSQQVWASIGP